jgi:predicted tellurium resistance membrane protein TerC
MGIDNVMGVAGVSNGNMLLVAIGILITIPMIIWGSTAFIRLLNHYPLLLYLGGSILAWTASGMITGDPIITSRYTLSQEFEWIVNIFTVISVLSSAKIVKRI